MSEIKHIIQTLVAIAIGAAVGYFVTLPWKPHTPPEPGVIVQTDTLYLRDTLRVSTPVYVRVRVVDTIRVPVPVPGPVDTVWAELPREEKVYGDSTYRAVVSGYLPSLDTMEVYRTTVTVTNTVQTPAPRWSIGVHAGATLTEAGIKPGIGVGIQYNIWPLQKRK